MDLIDMQIYLAIIKYSSISKAAQSLFLSQSNISRRLKLLEEELGVQLIYRQKGQPNIELTDSGRDFIPIAQKWVDAYNEANALYTRRTRITLSIAGVHSLNFHVLEPLFKSLVNHTPPVELSIHTNHTWEIYEMMNARQIDIGFSNNIINYADIIAMPIFSEDFRVIRKSNGENTDEFIHPQDLNPAMEICHTWSPEYQQWHDYWWDKNSTYAVKINASPLLGYFLDNPEHWAVVPTSVANTLRTDFPLDILKLTSPPPSKQCYLLKLKSPRVNSGRGLEIFDECLEDFIKHMESFTD